MQNDASPAVLPAPHVPVVERQKLDRRYVVVALMVVMVLASMEQTITATAMPTIIGDLHGLEHYSWVASIYLLACTVSMPLYGRLADAWGRKRVVLGAIAIFCAASLAAASAQSMVQLVVFRGLQGLGAGGIMPVVLTIIGDLFTIEERARIQGFFSAVWGTAALAGPALGALLVNTLGWRSIFYVNLPLGVVALAMLVWKYHDRERPHSTKLDFPGAVLLTIGCTGLLVLVSGMGTDAWPLRWVVAIVATTVLSTIVFVWHEWRTESPILPPRLILSRVVFAPLMVTLLLGVAFLSLDVYVPLYVQGGRGGGALAAASVVTPVMLTWALSGIFAAPMVVRIGFRKTALIGASLVILGFTGLLVCAIADAPHAVLTAVLAITGMGFGPISMSTLLAAQDAVTWQQRGVVTGSLSFFRTIGGAVGIGLLGGMFNVLVRDDLAALHDRGVTPATLLDPHVRQTLSGDVLRTAEASIAGALTWVFAAMLVGAVAMLGVALLIPNRKTAPLSKVEAFEAAVG